MIIFLRKERIKLVKSQCLAASEMGEWILLSCNKS
jgi:hypothetical protein